MVRWCNGNIPDCRSDVTGSIPVRTAEGIRPVHLMVRIPDFRFGYTGSPDGDRDVQATMIVLIVKRN